MKEIQQREFNRAIAVLEALGCEYKIITKTGEQFGGLEVVVAKPKRVKKRAANRYPYGALTSYARALMDFDLKPGDVHSIHAGDYDPKAVQRVTCSIMTKAWGADAYTTSVSGDHVDVMRLKA